MEKIKASELLLKIAADVEKIKEMSQLQTYQYNLILKRLNNIETVVPPKPSSINVGGSVKTLEKPPVGEFVLPKEDKVASREPEIQKNKIEKREEKIQEENKYDFDEKALSQKVPITQLVYTENGKPVSIAVVEILDENGGVFERVKTNSVGRWSALVYPGKYKVHLTRRYGTYTIDYEQDFVVPPGSNQIEIQPPEQYRRKSK